MPVKIVGVDIDIGDLIFLMLKVGLALIPVAVILGALVGFMAVIINALSR